jgi:alginate production protein
MLATVKHPLLIVFTSKWRLYISKTVDFISITGALSLFLLSFSLSQTIAQERFNWIEFYSDNKPYTPWEANKHLSFGLTLEMDTISEKNLNLNTSKNDDEAAFKPTVSLGVQYDNNSSIRAYAEFEISKRFGLDNAKNNRSDAKLEINQAYLTYHSRDENLAFTLGRWSVSDPREWLFDEELDGALFVWRNTRLAFEAMYAREQLVQKDLIGEHDGNEPDYYYTRLSTRVHDQSAASVYGLFQQGRSSTDPDLYWLGGSLSGKENKGIKYWIEAASVHGTEKGRDVRGYGVDVGFTKKFKKMSWKPRFTASFAFGSGDDGMGTDTAYRQTGIQGNEGRFGGRKNFKYYGEVFDPELINLAVTTLGVGFDLEKKTSLDFVYHNYFQHHASKKIRDSNLDTKPSGISRQLGNELDVIVGYRGIKNFKIDLIGGVFLPGAAFVKKNDTAWFLGLELEKSF